MDAEQALVRLFRERHGPVRWGEVVAAGIHPRHLAHLLEQGRIERVERGLYRWVEAEPLGYEEWLVVAHRVPRGVICLLSAAHFHHLTTFVPGEVQVALPNKSWRPRLSFPPVRYFYFSGEAYRYGVEEHRLEGGSLRVYSAEKTLADLLRYRNKLGREIFLEALKTYLGRPGYSLPRLLEAARACRVERRMREYAGVVLA
jgi:predicted transcriptional regulator of viral defense system